MREEYNIAELNPRRNPYVKRQKKQITINLNTDTVDYFKALAEQTGVPYQTLINSYLTDCAKTGRKPTFSWN